MNRIQCVVLAGLAAVLTAFAGDGLPPRASSSDYPVHKDFPNATIAAALVPPDVAKKIFPAELNQNFAVVEVAVFPRDGEAADVDAFDFGLKFNSGDVSHPRTPQDITSMWLEDHAPQPPKKVDVTGETGVVYSSGNDPVNGRTRSVGTYSSVAVGTAPPTPPSPPTTDRRDLAANVRAKALPEGAAARPVAGYLYFPLPAKRRKNGPAELEYLKDGVLTSLPIAAK